MSGRFRTVAAVLFVLVASAGVAVAATPSASDSGPGVDVRTAIDADVEAQAEADDDILGRECGVWHNETIDVNQTDGLDEVELDAVVCRTMARVEHIRGLEFEEEVDVSVQSREEFRERSQNRTVDPELRAFDNAKFEAMFLINQSTDSIDVQDRNRGASVLGYYSSATEEIVLVASNESALRVDELTLAHELVHALQDQHFDLSTITGETRDEVNARDGLVEGDARYVEYRYREARCQEPAHEWSDTCLRPPDDGPGGGELANYGVYFLKYQPYSDGPSFVSHLRSEDGWAAVDAAYDEPPESAEQVIHPEKYPDESPANVTLSDRAGSDWERVRPPGRPDYGEVGQAGIASMIVYPTYHSDGEVRIVPPRTWLNYTESGEISSFDPLNYGFGSAEGWAGDRMHVYQNDENETAYVWRIEWDTAEDAEEFLDDYHQVLHYWGAEQTRPSTFRFADGDFGDAIRVVHDNETITVVSAPTVEELAAVRNGSLPPANATVEEDWPRSGNNYDANSTEWSGIAGAEQPGFGPVVTLVAVLVGGAALARRRA